MIPQTYVWDIADPTVWGNICLGYPKHMFGISYPKLGWRSTQRFAEQDRFARDL